MTSRNVCVVSVLMVLTFVGCRRESAPNDGGSTPEGQPSGDCASSGQCSMREICSPATRRCELREGWGTECASNEACQAGYWCKQGLCVDRSQVTLCLGHSSAECPDGDRCQQVTSVCEEDLGCSLDADCSPSEVCNIGSRQCVPRCSEETAAQLCRDGERCVNAQCVECTRTDECAAGLQCDLANRCVAGPRCYSDRDCLIPLSCFTPTGACLPKPPPCLSNENCLSDERCDVASGQCLAKNCQIDRYEPNNNVSQSVSVLRQTYTQLTLCDGDVDWYRMTLTRGDRLGVNIDTDLLGESAFHTQIKDANGRTVSQGKLLASYVASATGPHDVVISSSLGNRAYDVTFLLARGTPCDDDDFEPNDTAMTATAMNASSQLHGMVCQQDRDWFVSPIFEGHGISARLSNYDKSRGILSMCLVKEDAQTIIACTIEPSVSIGAGVDLSTSAVFIRVSGDTDKVANTYVLEVEYP